MTLTEPTPDTTRPSPPPPHSWQPLLRRLHFYAGILVAPFMLVAAISGGLYAIAPSLEQVIYRAQLHTDSTGTPQTIAAQVDAAVHERPDLTVAAVRPADSPGDTTRVLFDDPSLGESERLAVFIDPVTAEPLGELVSYGSSAALPVRTWISGLHRNLHLGEPGRLYSELAASWLWVIALGGLILWVTRYRKTRRNNPDRARLLTVDRSTTGRMRTLNQHGALGVWLVIGLLFLSATGLTWSRYAGDNVAELRSSLNWTTPPLVTTLDDAPAPAPSGGHSHGGGAAHTHAPDAADVAAHVARIDDVVAVARGIGIAEAVEVTLPTSDDTAFTVTETRQAWQLSPNSVAVDGASGTIVDVSWFADWPLAAKLTTWGIALHMGLLFGLASQIALLVLAAVLVVVIVHGYRMWFARRPRRGGNAGGGNAGRGDSGLRVGSPPARGAWRRIQPVPAILAAIVTVAVGWFVPLLGITLAAFLVLDLIAGLVARMRTARVHTD